MSKDRDQGSEFRTYKVSASGVEIQLIESTKRLVSNELLTSIARYCDDVSESGQIPFLEIHHAKELWLANDISQAQELLQSVEAVCPECWTVPQFLLPAGGLAIEAQDRTAVASRLATIENLTAGQENVSELLQLLRISLVLAINTNFRSPDFDYRFRELKAKLQHANLMAPLTTIPLMSQFTSKSGM